MSQEISIDLLYRAESHLMLWRVVEEAGWWDRLGVTVRYRYCDTPQAAEDALISEEADFISGNHVTPYLRKAEGVPIVCIAQPWRHVLDAVVTRSPIEQLANLRGRTIIDRPLRSPAGGIVHPRGNHVLYLDRAGLNPDTDVKWLERESLRRDGDAMDAVLAQEADAAFISLHAREDARQKGLSVLELDPLPMVHGPTLTGYGPHLHKHPERAIAAIKGLARGMQFFRTQPGETQAILAKLSPKKSAEEILQRYRTVLSNLQPNMYPELDAIANAFRLCQMAYGERVLNFNPIAVWDIHYLREVDDSGFLQEAGSGL